MHLPVRFPLSRGGRDGLVGEDVERHLRPLLLYTGDGPDAGDEEEGGTDLDVLDEERDLHGAAHLPPHRAHPGLVTHQAGAGVSSTAARIAHQQRGIQLREEKGIISSSVIYVD